MRKENDYFYRVYDLDRKNWFKSSNGQQMFSNVGSAKTSARHGYYPRAERFEIWRFYCGLDSMYDALRRGEDISRFIPTKVFEQ